MRAAMTCSASFTDLIFPLANIVTIPLMSREDKVFKFLAVVAISAVAWAMLVAAAAVCSKVTSKLVAMLWETAARSQATLAVARVVRSKLPSVRQMAR